MSDKFILNTKADSFNRKRLSNFKVHTFYTFRDICLKLHSMRKSKYLYDQFTNVNLKTKYFSKMKS
jgi:hypothetical protein